MTTRPGMETILPQETTAWRIHLLGRFCAWNGRAECVHFSMRRGGALLACLVLRSPQSIPREELLALLWPEEDTEAARNRFRVLLSGLKRQLEPDGTVPGSVLAVSRGEVSLRPDAFTSDYHDFLQAIRNAANATDDPSAITALESALTLYQGELLAGFYEDWALTERCRLSELRYQALRNLVHRLTKITAFDRALEYARQAIAAEPLDEEAHYDLMRLYSEIDQPSTGLRQYEQLKRLLKEDLQAVPSEKVYQLAVEMEARLGHGVSSSRRRVRPITIRATEIVSDSLPPHLNRFFGREEELEMLHNLLHPEGATRLVSLLGLGGAGKTRLAVETAERLRRDYRNHVYFAPLAEVVDPRHIGNIIAKAMHLPPAPNVDPLAQVMAVLSRGPSLLVLDNLEQLLPDVSPQIEFLLSEVPSLRCLLTSRRSAGIAGEREIALGPLRLPARFADISSLAVSPGVALFVDRARAVRADFMLTPQNAEDVAQLCRVLDGMPLAIELAAARIRVMTPGEMLQQTARLLDWLVDAQGGKLMRHRSLRATLEWSYRLLTTEERRLFCALSVFAGSFTTSAAARVGLGESVNTVEVLALLERLCAASLLYPVETAGERTRFAMLQPLRELGQELLSERHWEAETRRRHLALCANVASHPELVDKDITEENHYEALEYGLRAEAHPEEKALALELASGLADHWEAQGRWSEGRNYLRRALQLPEMPETSRGRRHALRGAGALAWQQGDLEEARLRSLEGLTRARTDGDLSCAAGCLRNLGHIAFCQGHYREAQERFQEAMRAYESLQDTRNVVSCLIGLGQTAFYQENHPEAEAFLLDAMGLCRRAGDSRGLASVLLKLGNVLRNQGYLVEGRSWLLEAMPLFEETGSRHGVANCLHDLGLVTVYQGDFAEARRYFATALETFRDIGHPRGMGACLLNLGGVALEQGEDPLALTLLAEGLTLSRKLGNQQNIAACLLGLANLERRRGAPERALHHIQEALVIEREIESTGGIANCRAELGQLALEQGDLSAAQAHFAGALASYHQLNVRHGMAGGLEACALLAQHLGQPVRAVRLAAAAAVLRRAMGSPLSGVARAIQAEMLAAVRRDLGEAPFTAAWQEGEALALQDAVVEATQGSTTFLTEGATDSPSLNNFFVRKFS